MALFSKGKGAASEGAKASGAAQGTQGLAAAPTTVVAAGGPVEMAAVLPTAVVAVQPAVGLAGPPPEASSAPAPPAPAADPLAAVAVGGGGNSAAESLAEGLMDAFKKEEILLDRNVASLADEVEPAEAKELVDLLHLVANNLGIEAMEVEPD